MAKSKKGKLVIANPMKPEDRAAFIPVVRGLSGSKAIDAMVNSATGLEEEFICVVCGCLKKPSIQCGFETKHVEQSDGTFRKVVVGDICAECMNK